MHRVGQGGEKNLPTTGPGGEQSLTKIMGVNLELYLLRPPGIISKNLKILKVKAGD